MIQNLARWLVADPPIGPLSRPVQIAEVNGLPFCENWTLEQPIFRLPTGDDWILGDACQGVCVLGATGSGKTSASGTNLALKLLHLGAGGLVLCVKVGEGTFWKRLAKLAGRENDLLFVTDREHGFNVFDYELKRSGRGAGLTMNLVNLFKQLYDLTSTAGPSKMVPDFWERAAARLIANAVHLQSHLDKPFTLQNIREIISSSPKTIKQANSDKWAKESECGIACTFLSEHFENDYEIETACDYFSVDLPQMGDKQRAGIFETWEGLADPLLRSPLRQKFFEETTWIPEDAFERGKIIIIDLPVKEYDFAGRMAGVIAKFMCQRAVERRTERDERMRRPFFIWADEFENFATTYDNLFQKTARSSKAMTVYLGQNIPGILACLGGQSGDPFMRALLGNLTTHIYHANAEEHTNRFAAEAIGKDVQLRRSTSAGESQNRLAPILSGSTSVNSSTSEHIEYVVQPIEFTKMRTGGLRNNRIVDAIFFQASRTFSDGNNFSRVYFTQPKQKIV